MKNPTKVTMKNGKPAWKGTCPKCGNSVFRIGACIALSPSGRRGVLAKAGTPR
jgi:hypothetical protein